MWYNHNLSTSPALCKVRDFDYFCLIYHAADGKAFDLPEEDIDTFDSGYWEIDQLIFIAYIPDLLAESHPEFLV